MLFRSATISRVLELVRRALPGADVLVVDDGSTDGTPEIVTALAARKLVDAPPPGPRHPAIVHGLAALPFEERAVLLLISLEGFGYDATARIVGAPRESVLAWLRRARQALASDAGAPAEGSRASADRDRRDRVGPGPCPAPVIAYFDTSAVIPLLIAEPGFRD